METKIIDGRKIKDEILMNVKKEVAELSFVPVFCDILVGEDKASVQYVNMKMKIAESVGIHFYKAFFPSDIKNEDLVMEIEKINNMPNMCGIIIQLPLPSHIDTRKMLDAIDPRLDVDCLGSVNSNKFYENNFELGFPTAMACMRVLESTGESLVNKKIVVLGKGELVGRPVSALLNFQQLNVEAINSSTPNKDEIIKQADVIISGMGNGKYLTGSMIKKWTIIVDAGSSELGGSIVGDVDLDSVSGIAEYVSPVPGGVGPVTVAMLLSNVLQVAKSLDIARNKNK